MKPGGINLHLYPANMVHQSRILKTTATLEAVGYFDFIDLVGIHQDGLPEREILSRTRSVWRVPDRFPRFIPKLKSLTFFAEWYGRILWRYCRAPVTAIQCHSVFDLPLGVLFKMLRRGRVLIYDAHELETERNGLTGLRQRVARTIERRLMKHVDQMLAVSPSIVAWYERQYGASVALVRNRPSRAWAMPGSSRPSFRVRFGIDSGLLFVWQGALMPGRGIHLVLEAFARAPADRHVVFMGYGVLEDTVATYAASHPNIHLHEVVPPQEVKAMAEGADIGLSIIDNSCLSYYYCLPNKLYEYTQAGLAVVVSDFPDMGAEVDRMGNGWKVEVRTEAILRLVTRLSREEVEEKKRRSREAAQSVDWESEAPVLLGVYRELLGPLYAPRGGA